MRWKLGKGSFRQKELPISNDDNNKSMPYETNQKSNVFTITQLTPSELTATDNNVSCQMYKPRSSGDSNFNNSNSNSIKKLITTNLNDNNHLATTTATATVTSHQPSSLASSHHQYNISNKIRRRSSFEEALKHQHNHYNHKHEHHINPDTSITTTKTTTTGTLTVDKYHDNKSNNEDIFIISSNQIEQQQQQQQIQSVPWANNFSHHHYHPNNNNNNTNSNQHNNLSTSSSISVNDHATVNSNQYINGILMVNGGSNNRNLNGSIVNADVTTTKTALGTATKTTVNNNTNTNTNTTTTTTTTLENSYADESNSNNFNYINSMTTATVTNPSSNGSLNNTKIGSTTKLLPNGIDDQSSTQSQSKCSYFGGLLLCLCLNLTYTNIIRFPRELDEYGTAYMIPYLIILFLVGLPVILLEVSIGQFLGQGAANTWRASPILKGASVISRLASWLATIWISMQATLAIVYIWMLIFKSVPFSECASGVKITVESGYQENGKNGQECIQKTFLSPVWINAQFFGFLSLGLAILWLIALICTYNAKVFRRISFFIGTIGFILLVSLTVWEVYKSLGTQYFPQLWQFDETILLNSGIWFSALIQVIYSTNIGFGVIPVMTGKFLHKGDAIRTTILYFCFNLLINVISVILFMVQFDNIITRNSDTPLKELKPLTAVYDKVINENDIIMTRLIPGIIYSLFVISAIISITIAIYTSSRLVPRHPSYLLNLLGLITSVMALIGPKFIAARVLDSRIVGTLVIIALVFDLIAIIWIYGVKNIRTDLEFSIGRTIYMIWIILWCSAPVILTAILVWWCVGDDQFDLLHTVFPRWGPIIFVIAIIIIIACIEICKQVDYNFFGMICEAAKPAKEWGPADPLARHAWKQWRSVCHDTGRKDFTLRRRGTRDYTHSIKKGQYSTTQTKYGTQNWKSSTPGNSSPNYSGSVFGDSAIEEDMSIDKYSAGIDSHNFTGFSSDNNAVKPMRYSNRSRKISHHDQRPPQRRNSNATPMMSDKHREIVYIRRMSNERNNSTKIEITPASDNIVYSTRNSVAASSSLISPQNNHRFSNIHLPRTSTTTASASAAASARTAGTDLSTENNGGDHICWRKFSVNSEEYSTEL